VVALSECGTHAFLAAQIGSYETGERTLAQPLYSRLWENELLTAARAGLDTGDTTTVPDAFDERGLPVVHLARVIEYDVSDLVHQEIRAYLIVHHAISALIAKASAAADQDPDRVSFVKVLRLVRRTATGTADISPSGLG
jgi:hypothetical protein